MIGMLLTDFFAVSDIALKDGGVVLEKVPKKVDVIWYVQRGIKLGTLETNKYNTLVYYTSQSHLKVFSDAEQLLEVAID